MSKLDEIVNAVRALSDEERAKLRAFLDEIDWQAWDKKIEQDGAAGKLDAIEARARVNLKSGNVRKI